MTRAFAAVDLGASSGRVMRATVSADALELTELKRFRNGPVPVGRRLYWDILGLWQDILEGLGLAGEVASIGIDTWAVDYGLIDVNGSLLGNPRHYRDSRTEGREVQLDALLSRADLYRRNGLQFLPFNTIYQLMAEQEQPALAGASRALLIPDLLGYWLTGQERTEVTNASTTGLLDAGTREWSPELLELIGLEPALLADLIQPGERLGSLLPAVAAHTGLAATTEIVTVGSHDTASAVVGVPAHGADFAYIACGTWGLVGVELAAPVLTEASLAANFTNELGVDGTVRYLRNVMGLWVLQQCLREWQQRGEVVDIQQVVAAAASLVEGGPVIDIDDPSLLAPGAMVDRVRALCRATGQRVPDAVGEVARVVLDSLARAFADAVHRAAELSGTRVDVVHLVGGGSLNALLCQLTADACRLPVIAGPVEATALGNVLVQARAQGAVSGGLADLRSLLRRTQHLVTYQPREQARS